VLRENKNERRDRIRIVRGKLEQKMLLELEGNG
jgi:hypothetical protein